MEHMIQLHIEKLPEGVYLATSDERRGSGSGGARAHDSGDDRDRAGHREEVDRIAVGCFHHASSASQRGVQLSADHCDLMGQLAGFRYRDADTFLAK